ncbi:AAA family ATPase [Streptococcus sp. 27098_8_74]|uniref:AAA family ATPase n=1 Tax=Streptococcus sp. 27098_8_74 TaxID=3003646 RepID=UPI00352D6CB2
MSKGETNVLLLISQILQIFSYDSASGDYIVLIDEIETGMHLEWSRRILGFVVNYIKNEISEKNSNVSFQFVFTTHSPFMLSDIKPGNVVSLEKEKGKTFVREHTNTFAKNIQEIMNEDMLISNIYGDFALLKINSLINKLREDKIENKEVFLKEIKMISEPILRNKLLDMYHQKFDTSEDLNRTLLDKMNLTTEERQKILDILDKKNN